MTQLRWMRLAFPHRSGLKLRRIGSGSSNDSHAQYPTRDVGIRQGPLFHLRWHLRHGIGRSRVSCSVYAGIIWTITAKYQFWESVESTKRSYSSALKPRSAETGAVAWDANVHNIAPTSILGKGVEISASSVRLRPSALTGNHDQSFHGGSDPKRSSTACGQYTPANTGPHTGGEVGLPEALSIIDPAVEFSSRSRNRGTGTPTGTSIPALYGRPIISS